MTRKRYNIRQIFADMELDLIKSMKRNLAAHEAEEDKKGFHWNQWQQRKLAALEAYRKRNRKIVEQRAPEMEQGLRQTLRSAFRQGAKTVADAAAKLWNRFGFGRREEIARPVPGRPASSPQGPVQPREKGLQPPRRPREELPKAPDSNDDHFFGINDKRLKGLTDASEGEMRQARHAMLRKMDDVYRETIFKAQVYHNSGAASLGQAIDMATRDFLDRGIDCITYADGRKVNVASYAEMALRAASQRAVFAGQGAERDRLGVRTVVISAHNNCSPMCLPWQGKVYIDDVYSNGKGTPDGKYPLLSTAMAGGLFHPNCRHNMSTYFPGRSRLPEPVDDETALGNYDAEQKQRYMERQIRKYKRREAGSVDPENQKAAKDKVKEWQKRLREHIAENEHLRRDSKREKVRPDERERPKSDLNRNNDAKQFERYKRVLGDRAPASLEDFQRMKYTESEKWNQAKGDYRKLSAYEQIVAREPQITSDLQAISESTGMDMVGLDYRLKSKDSYLRKVNSDSKSSRDLAVISETVANTNDVIRYTYQADGDRLVDRYGAVVAEMEEKGYSRHKLKNTWDDKRNPYRGVNAVFTSPEGQKFEVQFHTPESFALKNGRMHEIYEEYRLDSTSPERRRELTKEMFGLSAGLKKPKDIDKIK